jgi:F-type H+-transporting ATPase subunit epsilon
MSLYLEIASPQGMIFQGECHLVVIPASEGEIGVMASHEAFIASLKAGEINLFDEQQNLLKSFSLESGFADMQDHKLIVLVN